MDNPRPEKVAVVTEVKERLENANSVVVTEYRGLTVAELAELRGSLRTTGGRYKVYKNTLVRRAASEAGLELEEHLVGPTALAFAEPSGEGERGDVVGMAKALRDFAKGHPNLIIKGGLFDGSPIDADGIKALADIEPREVLLAKLAGLMAAPMQQLAGLLQALPRDFAYGLQALIEKGGADESAAPADEPAEAATETEPESNTESTPESIPESEVADREPAAETDETEEAGEEE